ncbi:DUF4181 domain-containing protein [Bacillus sp. Marseille-Q1617]|uniref:DUF4181 domain-containing protein n=1 Tax=Bacillus sp. Marseille-Q1617 TaxID=2736887 RepID=UPI001588726B|nr:DUF4181 domain-containing protein [Bacillus sp. Marseille-Q1617]
MLPFIIYTSLFIAFYFVVERVVRKRWNIQNNNKSGIEGVNTIHTWGLRIGWAIFFVTVVFIGSGLLSAIVILMLWGFDAYMQWKYNKAAREYLITLLGLGFFTIFIVVGYSFDLLI